MGKVMFLKKGEMHTAPKKPVIEASTIAVGSTVYLNENGNTAPYLVVHQGLPSTLYDSSCNGMWLLRKDILEKRVWNEGQFASAYYTTSTINTYLNGTFISLFDSATQAAIKQVKIPYVSSYRDPGTINSGTNGLSVKAFLLSLVEVGASTYYVEQLPYDGAKLSYFEQGDGTSANSKRIAYLNGVATSWMSRSPVLDAGTAEHIIYPAGTFSSAIISTANGVRPAFIVSSTAVFNQNTLILEGV